MKFVIILFAMMALAYCETYDVEKEWADFKVKFNRTYTDDEEILRKKVFTDNLKRFEEHDKKYEAGEVSYTIGINQFADKTKEELENKGGCVKRPTT